MTSTTAQDFLFKVKLQEDLEEKVLNWTRQLCEALGENYQRYCKRHGFSKESEPMRFRIQQGKKYLKIISQEWQEPSEYFNRPEGFYKDQSVHAFVNRHTGEIHKPKGWAGPVKKVRYDFRVIADREFVLNPDNCGWAGGYLYQKRYRY